MVVVRYGHVGNDGGSGGGFEEEEGRTRMEG